MKIETKFDIGEKVYYTLERKIGDRCCECGHEFTQHRYNVEYSAIWALKMHCQDAVGYIVDDKRLLFVIENEIFKTFEEAKELCNKLNQEENK